MSAVNVDARIAKGVGSFLLLSVALLLSGCVASYAGTISGGMTSMSKVRHEHVDALVNDFRISILVPEGGQVTLERARWHIERAPTEDGGIKSVSVYVRSYDNSAWGTTVGAFRFRVDIATVPPAAGPVPKDLQALADFISASPDSPADAFVVYHGEAPWAKRVFRNGLNDLVVTFSRPLSDSLFVRLVFTLDAERAAKDKDWVTDRLAAADKVVESFRISTVRSE